MFQVLRHFVLTELIKQLLMGPVVDISVLGVNPLTAELFNLNFHPLVVGSR